MRKILIYVLVFSIGLSGGMVLNNVTTKQPVLEHKCPEYKQPILNHKCNPAVEVQSLDLDNIRKIKGNFTYSPVYNGDVIQKIDTCK